MRVCVCVLIERVIRDESTFVFFYRTSDKITTENEHRHHLLLFRLFIQEYARLLARQATVKNNEAFGQSIGPKAFDLLTEDQLLQLHELYSEIKKSSPPVQA